jgi:beta-N-acetylhexosaminidase
MVKQEVRGFVDGGVLCAPKHFPGHGSTGEDTHDGFAASTRTTQELENCDLIPFREAIIAGAPMIMVGHMTMTEIDRDNPASLSGAIVNGILRAQMGYEGIIITDALNMNAITDLYTSGEAAVKAVQAGCDMLLCVNNLSSALDALTEAVENGEISESRINESVIRILAAKYRYGIAS